MGAPERASQLTIAVMPVEAAVAKTEPELVYAPSVAPQPLVEILRLEQQSSDAPAEEYDAGETSPSFLREQKERSSSSVQQDEAIEMLEPQKEGVPDILLKRGLPSATPYILHDTMSRAEIEKQVRMYEEHFGMSSTEHYERWRIGNAPDTWESMDWAILYKLLRDVYQYDARED